MSKRKRGAAGSAPPPPPPLFDLRFLVLATVSILVGSLVGTIAWMASTNPWAAVLAGLSAAGVTLGRLHSWTGP